MPIGAMSDAEFLALLNAVIATISADLASYPGVTAAMMTELRNLRDQMADKLLAHTQAQEAAKAATIAKNQARADAEVLLRQIHDLLKANNVAADKYAALGIPQAESGAPANATVPVATVDTSERLRRTIHFSTPRRAATSVGRAATVARSGRRSTGAPPGSEKDRTFLALDRNTPYVTEYDAEHAGKTLIHRARLQLSS